MISRTVEYALRAVVHLADRAPELRNLDQIAEATRVPRAYLSKVMQNLGRAGVVHSRRGIGGGMTLAKAPSELTLLEVVGAVEPIKRIRTCPLGLAAHGARLCPLHERLDGALAMVEEAFRQTTLAELLSRPRANMPRCRYPEAPGKAGR